MKFRTLVAAFVLAVAMLPFAAYAASHSGYVAVGEYGHSPADGRGWSATFDNASIWIDQGAISSVGAAPHTGDAVLVWDELAGFELWSGHLYQNGASWNVSAQ